MNNQTIEVIATTISGSIKDWGKVEKIIPLFAKLGRLDVRLHTVDSHLEARYKTSEVVNTGARTIISAGGSGTFNSVLEGCIDTKIPLSEVTLGFLRKGSADLIGKTLGMPDKIEDAIRVFVNSLAGKHQIDCDVIQVTNGINDNDYRHFVGYSGAGIFGRIPHFTENRFIKFYKGVLSQLFGDMGPFFVGASLTVIEKVITGLFHKESGWRIQVDGKSVSSGHYQAMIIVNGDLGPDLPFARSVQLGSGNFHLFTIRNLGTFKLLGQFRRAWNTSIIEQAETWGFESFCIQQELVIEKDDGSSFPVNVDGSTMICEASARFRIIDQIKLISSS